MEEEEIETEKCEKPSEEIESDPKPTQVAQAVESEEAEEPKAEPEDEDDEEMDEAEELPTVKDSADENSELDENTESESEDKTESEERPTYQPYSPHEGFYKDVLMKAELAEYEEEAEEDEPAAVEEELKPSPEGTQETPPPPDEEPSVKNLKRKEPQPLVETGAPVETGVENGKKKGKEEKPPTKVVVRRLPPSMTMKTFLEQVSPLPPVDYSYFVPADTSMGINSFSRAYLNFINQEDLFAFTRTFDNYVFLDVKGQEYPAIVEFAPFQRVPKLRSSKKKDSVCGSIDADPAYITFKENILAEALESSKPGANTVKQHYFETENVSSTQEVSTTPLLEFLKVKRAEKARMKEERREEKRRKEAERKLKQKAKEKKQEAGEDEEGAMSEVKVLQPSKDKKDGRDRDGKIIKRKDREEKEKPIRDKQTGENRTREFKSRSGKSYQEERQKQIERREEQKKKSMSAGGNSEGGNTAGGGNGEEGGGDGWPSISEGKKTAAPLPDDKKRIYESKRNSRADSETGAQHNYKGEVSEIRKRNDRVFVKRERKDDAFSARRRNAREKKNTDALPPERRRTKVYKNSQQDSYSEKKKDTGQGQKKETSDEKNSEENRKNKHSSYWKDNALVFRRRNSLGSKGRGENQSDDAASPTASSQKRRNSIGSENIASEMIRDQPKTTDRESEPLRKHLKNSTEDNTGGKDRQESAAEGSEGKRGQKKQDKEEGGQNKSTKDPRSERRIRNKDRPSIEIYRPGMGKFSKQRLEKEKALGSSTEVESPSHSPSPTPKTAKLAAN